MFLALLFFGAEFFAPRASFAAQSVSMSWDASPDASVVGYNVYYGVASRTYTNILVAGNSTNIIISGLREGVTYYFAATAFDATGTESDYSSEASYTVPVVTNSTPTNLPPTITSITLGNQTIQENSAGAPMSFIIGDPDTAVNLLTLSAWSSNPQLIPAANIIFGGSGSNRTVQLIPAANQFGSASLTLIVTDDASNSTTVGFSFYVTSTNSTTTYPPTIGSIANQSIQENSSTATIPFVIGDPDTAATSLTLSASSSNTQLVPAANITFGGAGSNRTVQVTPSANQFGTANISVTVMDNTGNAASTSFLLTVSSAPPTISSIANQTIQENSSTATIPFVIGDPDTAATSLILSAQSSNPQLAPISSIVFGGSGSNRTVRVTPVANQIGSASLSVIVTDTTGNSASAAFSLSVLSNSVVAPVLVLVTNGSGAITPNLSAQKLQVGKIYSAVATPASGHLFAGWSGTFSWSSPKINFTLVSNTVLQANFIPSPYVAASGTYNGLFSEEAGVKVGSAGAFTASLTTGGTYSGRVQMAGGSASFSGKMSLQCRATNLIKIKTNYFTLVLQAGSGSQAGQMSGYMTDGTWVSPLLGDRANFNAKTNPAPQAGTYTMMIHGTANDAFLPAGHSFGYVTVSSGGIAKFAGTLADGTKITQSVSLSPDGLWPLFVPLYSGKGLMTSWQTFETQADTDFDGDLVWIKLANPAVKFYPAGFNYFRHVFGMTYTPPSATGTILNFTNAVIPFADGDLAASFGNYIQILPGGKVANLSTNQLTMKFSLTTGLFSGKVTDPVMKRSWSFSGAVLQKDNAGYGFLTGTNETSQVALFPN